jgi:hypothetical protein
MVEYSLLSCNNHISQSRGLEKLGRQGAICQFHKELSWRFGTLHIFLGIKLFLFVKIES